MPRKPIELPPEIARNFVRDMHAFLPLDTIRSRQMGSPRSGCVLFANTWDREINSCGSLT